MSLGDHTPDETRNNKIEKTYPPIESAHKDAGKDKGMVRVKFSGPLPPPSILADYESVVPGSANRIMQMAEDQGIHRRAMEALEQASLNECIVKSFDESRRGQYCALIIAIVALIGATWLGLTGHEIAAAAVGLPAAGSLVLAFLKTPSAEQSQPSEEPPAKPPKRNKRK